MVKNNRRTNYFSLLAWGIKNNGIASIFFAFSGLLSSCVGSTQTDIKNSTAFVTTMDQSSGTFSATLDNIDEVQQVSSNGDTMGNITAIFPAGSLSIPTSITFSKTANLNGADVTSALGVTSSVLSIGNTIEILPENSKNLNSAMTLSLPGPSSLALVTTFPAIFYSGKNFSTGEYVTGIIGSDDITVSNGAFTFEANYFGKFQTVYTDSKTASGNVNSTTELVKTVAASSPDDIDGDGASSSVDLDDNNSNVGAPIPFVFKIAVAAAETVTIDTLDPAYSYDFKLDWGDGSPVVSVTSATTVSHTYSTAGEYTVEITGRMEAWNCAGKSICMNNLKEVVQLGASALMDASSMFEGASLMHTFNAGSADTRVLTNVANMFKNTTSLNSANFFGMNTSGVTDFSYMFSQTAAPSLDLSNISTISAQTFNYMFSGISSMSALDLSMFSTKSLLSFDGLVSSSSILSLDVSNWDLTVGATASLWNSGFSGSVYCNDPDGGGIGAAGTGTFMGMSCL